jgi:hypothetical protein
MSFALAMADSAASRQDEVQEMRALASSVTANVLIYYNLNGPPYHIGNDEAYRNDMVRLLGMATQFDHGEITEQVQNLGAAIAELKNLPQSATAARSTLSAYAHWLPSVLNAHAQLDSALGALHDELPPASETHRALHDLSHEIGQLLVEYQQASSPYLASGQPGHDQAGYFGGTPVRHAIRAGCRFGPIPEGTHPGLSLRAPAPAHFGTVGAEFWTLPDTDHAGAGYASPRALNLIAGGGAGHWRECHVGLADHFQLSSLAGHPHLDARQALPVMLVDIEDLATA